MGVGSSIKDRMADMGDDVADRLPGARWLRALLVVLVIYLVVAVCVGIYWSIAPDPFDVRAKAGVYTAEYGGTVVTGSVTTAALMGVVETLLQKPGGYLSNDRFPPGLWLDNMPNWEFGVLVQVRDLSRAMREAYSRSQSQSTEDPDLALAEPLFNFESYSWILPASEGEYGRGLKHVRQYFLRLSDAEQSDAQFYARADNLTYWLGTVETRLGSLSQRLSASVGQRRLNTDLAGEAGATQSTRAPKDNVVQTPWSEIDDVFYEARGTAWALIQFLQAAEQDFGEVLDKKNARVSLRQIVRELEATQEVVFSPIILNGSGFGLVANHSLVMASYLSRANAGIINLRGLLQDG
jgi:hypothetical protein